MRLCWSACQATSFCWGLSRVRLALASRCSLWPSTQSSGAGAPLLQPFRPEAQGLLHGSVPFLGFSSLLLPRERTGADQTLLCSSSEPLPCSPFCLPVPSGLFYPQPWWTLVPGLCLSVPGLSGWCCPRECLLWPGVAEAKLLAFRLTG